MSTAVSFDLAILGAGPSGSALALAMARQGWRVALFEKHKMPRDKVCGGFIGPENAEFFKSFGLETPMRDAGFANLSHLMLSIPGDRFIQTPLLLKGRESSGWGVLRREFDGMMFQEAQKNGVVTFENCKVESVESHHNIFRIAYRQNHQSYFLESHQVADARGTDASEGKSSHDPMGIAAEFESAEVSDSLVSVHYVRGGHCGIDPIGKGRITMGYVAGPKLFEEGQRNPDKVLQIFRERNVTLERLLGKARQITSWRGTRIHLVKKLRFLHEGMFCVGDAVGNVNPVGGVGLTFAMQSSAILSTVLQSYEPSKIPAREAANLYEKLWRSQLADCFKLSRWLGRFGYSQTAASVLMKIFQTFPGVLKTAFEKQHPAISLELSV